MTTQTEFEAKALEIDPAEMSERIGVRPHALETAHGSMTLLVAAVIVHDQDNNRVVLLQRGPNAKFAQGLWDLPTGKNDPGEPITETAVRELREETGLVVNPRSLRLAHVIHGAWGVESPNGFLTVVFATDEWTGELTNPEPDKHAQVRWVDTNAIPQEFVPSTANALAHYLSGDVQVTLRGWNEADGV
jgi:8-oxo-dGTP pyrophosphatase MutT (NUDIX family)